MPLNHLLPHLSNIGCPRPSCTSPTFVNCQCCCIAGERRADACTDPGQIRCPDSSSISNNSNNIKPGTSLHATDLSAAPNCEHLCSCHADRAHQQRHGWQQQRACSTRRARRSTSGRSQPEVPSRSFPPPTLVRTPPFLSLDMPSSLITRARTWIPCQSALNRSDQIKILLAGNASLGVVD